MLIILFVSLCISFGSSQISNILPGQRSTCGNPQGVLNCYITYLQKYGIRPFNGFLPPFIQLETYVKTQIDLVNTCRDFDELQQCLGPSAATCINVPVFALFTLRQNPRREAIFYLQNHAFFEFVCGVGRASFMANSNCLSRSFAGSSLTRRMHRCTNAADLTNNCPAATAMSACVKESIVMECGPAAAQASCGAATNIIRREGEVDAGCLFQMDQLCSSATIFSQFIAIFLVLVLHQ